MNGSGSFLLTLTFKKNLKKKDIHFDNILFYTNKLRQFFFHCIFLLIIIIIIPGIQISCKGKEEMREISTGKRSRQTTTSLNNRYLVNQKKYLLSTLKILEDSLTDTQNENYKNVLSESISDQKKRIAELDFLIQKIQLEEEKEKNRQFQKLIWLLSGVIVLFFISIIILYFLKKEKDKKRDLQLELNHYKQNVLNRQLNPHFLYNALNSIQYFILQNNKENSNEYISRFSHLMRIILDNSQLDLITVDKELEAIKVYLSLECIRFGNKLSYRIQCNEEARICKIPPSLLQPFVENAIWHGILHKAGPGNIVIEICEDFGLLKIRILDDGIGTLKSRELYKKNMLKKNSQGILLSNKRLEIFKEIYKNAQGKVTISPWLNSDEYPGTCVEITLPSIR